MLSSMFTRILDKDRRQFPLSYLALVQGLDFLVSWASTVTFGDTVVPSHEVAACFRRQSAPQCLWWGPVRTMQEGNRVKAPSGKNTGGVMDRKRWSIHALNGTRCGWLYVRISTTQILMDYPSWQATPKV